MLGAGHSGQVHVYEMESWPDRLKRLRMATKPRLSQAAVARHFGIAPPSVAQWEIGRSKPDINKLPRLATLYNVTLETLCGKDLAFPRGYPTFQNGNEIDETIEQQLLFLKRAWRLLTTEERAALMTTAEALAAPRRKSA
jgi:transcriptional regulator with XRE-family HTH domain